MAMIYAVSKMRLTLLLSILWLAAIGCSASEEATPTPTLSPADVQAAWESSAPGIPIPSRESVECMMERASLPGAALQDVLDLPSRDTVLQRSASLYYSCLTDEEAGEFYGHLDPRRRPIYPPSFQRCAEERVGFEEFFESISGDEPEGGVFPQWFTDCIPQAEGAPPYADAPSTLSVMDQETMACMNERTNLLGAAPQDVLELPGQHPMRQRLAALLYACYTDEYASELYSHFDPSLRPGYPPSFQRCAEEQVGFEEFLRFMTMSDQEAAKLEDLPSWFYDCEHLIPP
ncbi:MAG: hypothetical protein OXL97_09410 [Chloroflexota bacterium]|nr:hypothetical protein [Chloroflexota bacterium]